MCCVRSRIKVLDAVDFHDAETKINRFLETDESIQQLVNINYNLEYGNVIVEYNIFDAASDNNYNTISSSSSSPLYYDYWTQLFSQFFPPINFQH